MTHTITLEPEIDAAIAKRAAVENLTPDEYLRRLIEQDVLRNPEDAQPSENLLARIEREFGLPEPRPNVGVTRWSETDSPFDTCDTGPIVAFLDANDIHHVRILHALKRLSSGPLVTTSACLAEVMHLLYRADGYPLQAELWRLRTAGILQVYECTQAEYDSMSRLMETFRDIPMDL